MPREIAIAVIDDDESFRLALVESLFSLGYGVCGFASAEEFIGARNAKSVDCIVTDVNMPGMSGLDLIRHLVNWGSSTPVVLVTARSEVDLEIRAVAAGAVCLLRKPFETTDLIDCLGRALKI